MTTDEAQRAAIARKNAAYGKVCQLRNIALKYRNCGNEPPPMIAAELAAAEAAYQARLAEVETAMRRRREKEAA